MSKSNLSETQLSKKYIDVFDDQIEVYEENVSITNRNEIPDTTKIPLENQTNWLRIPDVVCVFVDMISSTKLSATKYDKSTARVYQLFTGTATRLFHKFDAPYIDVQGDGVFALFNSDQPYRALVAAVSFKTFVELDFSPRVEEQTEIEDLGAHIGIDQRTVLVRRIGLKRSDNRTDRQNEVWAGRPINMAAKLASETNSMEMIVSDRFYKQITHDKARMSCTCGTEDSDGPSNLWKEVDLSDDENFDFDTGYKLTSKWCSIHGKEYSEALLTEDEK